jgi:hypothetical protein
MQPVEILTQDSQKLLSELNRSTTAMMLIGLDQVGSPGWHEAHCRQQQAFAVWLRYLRQDQDSRIKHLGLAAA